MNLHEYQAKILLAKYGLPLLSGHVCYSPGEAEAAADLLGGGVCVVKAQVHAGGRGKAGGVKLAKNSSEARAHAEKILGMTLVTPQTGKAGKLVRKVYVEAGCNIQREFYLSFLVNRSEKCISIITSCEGGMEIEVVAHKSPEKVFTINIDPRSGIQPYHGRKLGVKLGLDAALSLKLAALVAALYNVFVTHDLSLIEINPLVLTKQGNFVLLDAKCSVDDNAIYRQDFLSAFRDYDEEDPRDLRASKHGLNFVGLDGSIGCMVNGAGLAMATMDIIKKYGGEPANFLDVGGGASKEAVTEAFKILLADSKVKGILVNIFGGIMKCDVIAQGIVAAAREVSLNVPLVVRLQGTNVELGRKLLSESGLALATADTMADAAQKIVGLTRGK